MTLIRETLPAEMGKRRSRTWRPSLDTDHLARDDRIYVYYRLSSTVLDPDAVTAATGITPTEVWRLGDIAYVAPGRTHYRKESGWRVKSDPAMSLEFDDHIRWVLSQLETGWDTLVTLGRSHQAAIICVVDTAESTGPGMHFVCDMIARFAELNAMVDIDYYSYRAGLSED